MPAGRPGTKKPTYYTGPRKSKAKRVPKTRQQFNSAVKSIAKTVVHAEAEKKYIDLDVNTSILPAGSFYELSVIPEGTTKNMRIGQEILLQNLQVRMTFSYPVAIGATPFLGWIRLFVIRWKDSSGTLSNLGQILQNPTVPFNITSPYNDLQLISGEQFSVLADKTIQLTDANTPKVITTYKRFFNLKFKQQFHGATGTGSHNSIWLIATSSIVGMETSFSTRIKYLDM